ncbi:MAG TPA: prepilin peptidase [Acidobacteriaceae bacterium]|nr:prepilin peptidase [Acidobacteriaceae bacterium]
MLAFELPAFLLGLLFGSFLNVCISRLPEHRSVVKPRSHCPKCLAPIQWYDNVPLLSWALLAGRCRKCKGAIPWRYPAVELATGLWFALVASRFLSLGSASEWVDVASGRPYVLGTSLGLVAILILGFLLIGLVVMDWQTHTLPDAFTLTGTAIGFFLVCVQAIFLPRGVYDIHVNPKISLRMSSPGSFQSRGDVFMTGPEHLVWGRVLAICAAAAIPWLIRALYKAARKQEGLGLGDVKLMAMIAAFLGFASAMVAFFVGVILGAVYGIVLLARRRATTASQIPLGTFLCIGGLVAALLGGPMVTWYRGFF